MPLDAWTADVDEGMRDGLLQLRGAVRSLFGAVAAGEAVDADAIEHRNHASAATPSWLHATAIGVQTELTRRRPPGATGAILAALAEDALAVAADPAVTSRLTACPCPGCLALFVQDDPRRRFCSPICGTRTRVARHYARQKQGKR
jgi:predicted RNA-binding Zn ribbon-like protein